MIVGLVYFVIVSILEKFISRLMGFLYLRVSAVLVYAMYTALRTILHKPIKLYSVELEYMLCLTHTSTF